MAMKCRMAEAGQQVTSGPMRGRNARRNSVGSGADAAYKYGQRCWDQHQGGVGLGGLIFTGFLNLSVTMIDSVSWLAVGGSGLREVPGQSLNRQIGTAAEQSIRPAWAELLPQNLGETNKALCFSGGMKKCSREMKDGSSFSERRNVFSEEWQ